MKYPTNVIKTTSSERRGPRPRQKMYVSRAPCAYCRGGGVDPKFGNFSVCPVCKGTREVKVNPPVVICKSCSGSGYGSGYLSCLACKGAGVVSVSPEAGTCPKCHGTGEDGVFYCSACKGQGIV
ncbi:MAG: hypothetical protein FJ128_13725 [Deltaproteobacteria bacterium]|nr:hypothetical protein [Deltaproteobacteria bacterium]